jgi:hypothetical protein
MEIDIPSPKNVSFFISLLVVEQLFFLVSTAVSCNAERCPYASLFIIQLYNLSCDCLCAFDYLMSIAVILIVIL